MSTAVEAFCAELRALGYGPTLLSDAYVAFDYEVELGPLAGRSVRVALQADGHPHSPPSGPFVSPHLLPLRPDGSPAPWGGVHEASGRNAFPCSPGVWQYWSRPYNEWNAHGRTVRAYIEKHLRRLFAELPPEIAREEPETEEERRAA